MMSNKVYDVFKWVAIILLPALAKLIEGVFGVWGIPYGADIASTIIYVQVFLGAILCISNISYKDKLKNASSEEEGKENE